MTQNDKKICLSHSLSKELYLIWLWFLVNMYNMISWTIFFVFSKFWFFGLLGEVGVKGQKMIQNDKKICLSHSLSKELYLIWLWFLVNMYNMISWTIFFVFSKFWFFGLLGEVGVKGQKMIHNYQFQSATLHISRTVDHIIKIFYTGVKWWYL